MALAELATPAPEQGRPERRKGVVRTAFTRLDHGNPTEIHDARKLLGRRTIVAVTATAAIALAILTGTHGGVPTTHIDPGPGPFPYIPR